MTEQENLLEIVPGTDMVEAETPGVILRRARLAAKLSEAQVAERLKFLPSRIRALEQDQYHSLKGDVFIKGYLRAYGKLLGMDTDALIDTYHWFTRANEAVSDLLEPVVNSSRGLPPARPHLLGKGMGVVLALIVLLLWFMAPADREAKPGNDALVEQNQPVEIDIRDRSIIEALGNESQGNNTEPVTAEVSELEGDISEDLLSLNFSGDCWVEVRDSDNVIIFADMRHAGDKLQLTGRAPFKVLLGYAPVVSMNYNGESVDINSNTRTHSARLVVGRS